MDTHRLLLLGLVLVDPNNDLLARVDACLPCGGALLDAQLGHARLHRLGHATHRLHLVNQLTRRLCTRTRILNQIRVYRQT